MKVVKYFLIVLACSFIFSCSSPSTDLVKDEIIKQFPNRSAFQLNSWEKVNSYTRTIEGEEVYYIEYSAKFELKKEYKKYLNSGAGISFNSEFYDSTGTVAFVKRGSKWYSIQ